MQNMARSSRIHKQCPVVNFILRAGLGIAIAHFFGLMNSYRIALLTHCKLVLILALLNLVGGGSLSHASCADLLSKIQPYTSQLKPNLGAEMSPFMKLPSGIQEFLNAEGGELLLLGYGAFGRVYKWTQKDGATPISIKYYFSAESAEEDDTSLDLLRKLALPDDFVQVVAEVRPPAGHLRFYEYVQGMTLSEINLSKELNRELGNTLVGERDAYVRQLRKKLGKLYGKSNVRHIPWDPATASVAYPDRSVSKYQLRDTNVILSSKTGRLVIIDPY